MNRYYCYLIILLVSRAIQVEGSCFNGMLQSSVSTDASGKLITESYCEYQNEKHAVGTTWTYPYPNCLECQCTSNGLSCCGYGVKAGVIAEPEECQLAEGTCDIKFVKKSDPSKLCFDTETSTSTSTQAPTKKKCSKKRIISQ